jgi:isovaleryl-CoA dehydrogenase
MQRVFGAAARRSLSLLNTNKKKLPHPPSPSAPSFSTASTSFLFDDTQLQVFFCSFLIVVVVVVVVYLLLCLLNDLLFLSFPQFKESVSQFAQENIAPHASTIDQSNYFPKVI